MRNSMILNRLLKIDSPRKGNRLWGIVLIVNDLRVAIVITLKCHSTLPKLSGKHLPLHPALPAVMDRIQS